MSNKTILSWMTSLILFFTAAVLEAQSCAYDRAENGQMMETILFAHTQLGNPSMPLVALEGSSSLDAAGTPVAGRLEAGLEAATQNWRDACPQSSYSNMPSLDFDSQALRRGGDDPRDGIGVDYKLDTRPTKNSDGDWVLAKYRTGDNTIFLPGKCPKPRGTFPLPCVGSGSNKRIDWGHPDSIHVLTHEMGHAYALGHDREDGACSGRNGIMRERSGSTRQIFDDHCQMADHQLCADGQGVDCPDDPNQTYTLQGQVPTGNLDDGQVVDVSANIRVPDKAAYTLTSSPLSDGQGFSFEVPDNADYDLTVNSSLADRECSLGGSTGGSVSGGNVSGLDITCTCQDCNGGTSSPVDGKCDGQAIYRVGVTGSGIENSVQLDLYSDLQLVSAMTLVENDQLTFFGGNLANGKDFYIRAPAECTVNPRPNSIACADNTSSMVTCACEDPFECGDLPPRFRCPEVVELCTRPPQPPGGVCTFYQRTYSVTVFSYPYFYESYSVRGWLDCSFSNLQGTSTVEKSSDGSGQGPLVYLRTFADGEPVSGQVRLEGVARHDGDGVSRLIFSLDGQPFQPAGLQINQPDAHTCSEVPQSGCDSRSGFSGLIDTTSLSNGPHTLEVLALSDRPGSVIPSHYEVTFVVDNAPGCSSGTLPSVQITQPAAGSSVDGTVTIEAQASDDVGVERVELLIDGRVVGQDLTSPYRWTWNTTSASEGSHTLRARAYDCGGRRASASVQVEVDNVAPAPDLALEQAWDGTPLASGATFAFPEPTPVGVPISRRFRLHNRGDADLHISNTASVVGGTCYHQIETPTPVIEPGESAYLRARLHCSQPGHWVGSIQIDSDDPNQPTYLLGLEGEVSDSNADIAVYKAWIEEEVAAGSTFTFPDPTPVGTPVSRRFRIDNVGGSDLVLSNANATVSGTCYSQIETPATPIAPGGSGFVRVRLHCAQAGTHTGSVTFQSNDPDEASYGFSVEGTVEAN